MDVLLDSKPFHVRFETCFTVTWPVHLGGGSTKVDTSGVIVFTPTMTTP